MRFAWAPRASAEEMRPSMASWPARGMVDPADLRGSERAAEDAAWDVVWTDGKWRWITSQMTSEGRELAADAVARCQASVFPEESEPTGLRWWRDTTTGGVTMPERRSAFPPISGLAHQRPLAAEEIVAPPPSPFDEPTPMEAEARAQESEAAARFQGIWLYCIVDHGVGSLPSGPCEECIATYSRMGAPDGQWNAAHRAATMAAAEPNAREVTGE